MSLGRQVLVLFLSVISVACFLQTGFLTIQRFLVVPGSHPLLVQAQAIESIPESVERPEGLPNFLHIPSVGIELPVLPSTPLQGQWQTTSKGVSLFQPEGWSIEDHGYVLYGHNWPNLLGNLQRIEVGQAVQLLYPNGGWERYAVSEVRVVSSTQVEVLQLAEPGTLVIYTCIGFLDSERLVVIAKRG